MGTDISTSLNCFGNVPGELRFDTLNLRVKRSSTYWYYDENFHCTGYRKDSFATYFAKNRDLLEPVFLSPDEYVVPTVKDVITKNDIVLQKALNHFNQNRR